MTSIESYIQENRDRFLEELKEFIRIPSVSALPEHREDMERCARYCADQLVAVGIDGVEVLPAGGPPVVYGEWLHAPGRPTVLVYGHYDVQPVDPIDLWTAPPFDPQVRDGELYARGSADDKGQLHLHWKAIETLMRVEGRLPVNVKFLMEGEEEIGSVHLDAFLERQRERLKADVAVVSDSSWFARGLPSICYGLRGLTYTQVDIKGPNADLHSGAYGGSIANPIQVLCEIIAQLKDANGRVSVPGFYDEVRALDAEERRQLARLPFDEAEYRRELGVPAIFGEQGYSTVERVWARPTLEINGIWGGFTGEGSKTVLPSRASAKISCRLVPNQDPERIAGLLEERLRALCPATVEMEITRMAGGRPALTPLDHPVVQSAARAMERAFQKQPAFIRSGGSIPVVASLQELLGIPVVLMGFSLPDDHAHAPDERLDLGNYFGGIQAAAYLMQEIARG